MNNSLKMIDPKSIYRLGLVALTICLFSAAPVMAVTDYIFFSVNGDTTATSMVQGDTVGWGSNCGVGDMLAWEMWVDVNANGVIDDPGDKAIFTFMIADGDTNPNGPPPDISPIPDGWYVSVPLLAGLAPSQYIFRVTNQADFSTEQKILTCSALAAPNVFRGQVTVEGHPAPDSTFLSNIWIEAEGQAQDFQFWAALTDDSGFYQINVGSQGTDLNFRIEPAQMPGYVSPAEQFSVASGLVDNIDFNFTIPADSLYGEIRDQYDSLLSFPVYVYCFPQSGGPSSKDVESSNGQYALYFGPSEQGAWQAGISGDNLFPAYLSPGTWPFRNDTTDNINHDFICVKTDTVLYARVTENSAPAVHNYRLQAWSDLLNSFTESISDTLAGSIVAFSISSLDASGWQVNLVTWDSNYQVPAGYVLDGGPRNNLQPGDTVDVNFIFGKMIQDTLLVDAGDPAVNWVDVWVSLWSQAQGPSGGRPDNNGIYTLYCDTGQYNINVNYQGYLSLPASRAVSISGDTTGGLSFIMNKAQCRVTGTLVNVATPLDSQINVWAHTDTGSIGYQASALVDPETGRYTLYLCDGDWTVEAPYIANYISPGPTQFTVGEAPDTAQTHDLTYSIILSVDTLETGGRLPKGFALYQNFPNPFNPTTQISFDLPQRERVELVVFNLIGQRVRTLVYGELAAGTHTTYWDGTDSRGHESASGIYFYRLSTESFTSVKKMLLVR